MLSKYNSLLAVITLPFLFGTYRCVEMMTFRKHQLHSLLDAVQNILLQTISDIFFFFLWNIPLFIFILLSQSLKEKIRSKIEKIIFIVLNLPLFFLLMLDVHTLNVRGDIFNLELIKLFRPEMFSMSLILIKEYYFFIIAILPAVYWIVRICPLILDKKLYSQKITLFLISISILSSTAYIPILFKFNNNLYPRVYTLELRYNGMAYRISKSMSDKFISEAKCLTTFFSKEELKQNLSFLNKQELRSLEKKKDNVVLVVIESFNYLHLKEKYTPFISYLSKNGYYSKKHMNHAGSTGRSTSSIVTSQFPHLVKVSNQSTKIPPPIKAFQKENYSTMFFFGGDKRTYDFDELSEKNNLKFFSKEDYLKEVKGASDHIDKSGDIFDGKFFSYVAKKIREQNKPFFSLILTNQPHYPLDCEGVDMKLSEEYRYLYCLKYIDQSIKRLFNNLGELSKNTLFIITGDHPVSRNRPENYLEQFRVPLILYSEKEDLSQYNNDALTNHVDIISSIIDFLNWENGYPISPVYNSIFDGKMNRAFSYSNYRHSYLMFFEDKVAEYSCLSNKTTLSKSESFFFEQRAREKIRDKKLNEKYDNIIKTYIQYTTHGLF